jgi:hypothetical protein
MLALNNLYPYKQTHRKNTPINLYILATRKFTHFQDMLHNVSFSTKSFLLHKLIFFCSNNIFFIKNAKNLNTNPFTENLKQFDGTKMVPVNCNANFATKKPVSFKMLCKN